MNRALIVGALTIVCLTGGSFALAQGSEPTTAAEEAALVEAAAELAEDAEGGAGPEPEDPEELNGEHFLSFFGVAMGVALTIMAAAYGISKIATSTVESMARQPEASGNMQMAMIIATAMIEGIAFFALIICLLEIFN